MQGKGPTWCTVHDFLFVWGTYLAMQAGSGTLRLPDQPDMWDLIKN